MFHDENRSLRDDGEAGPAAVSDVGARIKPSYVIKLCDFEADILLGGRIHIVHDVAFLDGYYEPTLVVCGSTCSSTILSPSVLPRSSKSSKCSVCTRVNPCRICTLRNTHIWGLDTYRTANHGFLLTQILYESRATWSGRVARVNDNIHMAAITVNPLEKTHHIVWQVPGLPFDCRRIQPIPKPLGIDLELSCCATVSLHWSCSLACGAVKCRNAWQTYDNRSKVHLDVSMSHVHGLTLKCNDCRRSPGLWRQ